MEESKQLIEYSQDVSVELHRSTKGVYSWDIKVRESNNEAVVDRVVEIDKRLAEKYIPEEPEAEAE